MSLETMDLGDITWQCMCCRETRADRFITVTKIHIETTDHPVVFNYRHCVDRLTCVTAGRRMEAGEYFIEEQP